MVNDMDRRWTEKESNEWYSKLPWIRGCNFLPSNCVNRLDMWQSDKKDEHLAVADRELALCKEIGFNSIRLWLDFDSYYAEPEENMELLESYISLCAGHGLSVMLVLTHEEDLPFGEKFVPKKLGEQKLLYNHFNRDYEEQGRVIAADGYRHYMEYADIKPVFIEMIKRVIKKYGGDDRIFCINVYNEPGNLLKDRSIPILKELFALVRSLDPKQPLCADIWQGINEDGSFITEAERVAYELSDVISFHCYSSYAPFVEKLAFLKEHHNRPIFMTEWLQRCNHNTVEEIYPLMYLENVGCYCWGFVGGDTYTTEPWDNFWKIAEENPEVDFDFTKWQHDLFRRNYRPYDPKELNTIKRFNALADGKGK